MKISAILRSVTGGKPAPITSTTPDEHTETQDGQNTQACTTVKTDETGRQAPGGQEGRTTGEREKKKKK